jgi:hypothetical protein
MIEVPWERAHASIAAAALGIVPGGRERSTPKRLPMTSAKKFEEW